MKVCFFILHISLASYTNYHMRMYYMLTCHICIYVYVGDYPYWMDALAVTQGTKIITTKSNESVEAQERWLKLIEYSKTIIGDDDYYHTLLDGQNYEGSADPLKDVEMLANSVLSLVTSLRSLDTADRLSRSHSEEAHTRSLTELLTLSHHLAVSDVLSFLKYHQSRLSRSNTATCPHHLSLLHSVDNSLEHQAEEDQLLFDLRSMNMSTPSYALNHTGTALVGPSSKSSTVTQYHSAWLAGCYPDPVVEGFSFDEHATLVMNYLRPSIAKGPAHLNQRSYNITDPWQCLANHSSSPSRSDYATAVVGGANSDTAERETNAPKRRVRLLCVTYSLSTRLEQVY